MFILFLSLAGITFWFGSGVALFPVSYGILVLLVYVYAKILQRRSSGYALQLLLASSSTLLAILIVELVLRIVWDDKLYYRSHDKFFERSTEFEGRYRYRPNVSADRLIFGDLAALSGEFTDRIYRREKFVTDKRGFRNSEVGNESPVDVLILGDSFGVGSDTTQHSIWPELLRRDLGLVTYNLSLPGSPADEMHTLLTELPRLTLSPRATVVWMIFSGNDLTESYAALKWLQDRKKSNLSLLDSLIMRLGNFQRQSSLSRLIGSFDGSSSKQRVIRQMLSGRGELLFYHPYLEMAKLTRREIEERSEFQDLTRTMEKMRKASCAAGFSVFVVIAPSKEEIFLRPDNNGASAFAEAVHPLCRQFSFSCLDLGPALIAASSQGGLLWWPDDTHWNPEGHIVVAETIAARLREVVFQPSIRMQDGCAPASETRISED